MKKEIEAYLSKSNLKNFNTFYKQYHSLYSKNKLTLISKTQRPNYFYQKKKTNTMNIIPLVTEPNQFRSAKKIGNNEYRNDSNLKNKIKQKLKLLLQTPKNTRNVNRNLKLHFNNSNTITLDVEKSNNNNNNNNNCIVNFLNDYEKEFFSDSLYLNLEYNENEIYNEHFFYEDLIKKKIIYLKNHNNYNKTKKFEKKFHYGKYQKEINLTFNSLQITFQRMILPTDNIDSNQDPIVNIDFPFEFLPIFYYKGFHTFIKFLSRVIRIENNFEKIIFEEEKVCEELDKIREFEIYDTDDSNFNESLILDSIPSSNHIINLNLERKEKAIHLKPQSLKRNSNFLRFNNFIFFWITNTKTYIVTVSLPSIHLNISDNKIIINNYVDYELLFYLYRKDFAHWEYYIIKNLMTYSKFRTIFQQINHNSKNYDENINLREPKQKINSFMDETLVNIYTDQFNKNIIIIFKSFHVLANIVDLSYHLEKRYHIHFNFFQYLKLHEIAMYSGKIQFLIKFIIANKEFNTLHFNFEEFDKFNIKLWMSNINKFSKKSLYSGLRDELFSEFDIFPKTIKVEYVRPKYSIVKIDDGNEVIKSLDVENELEKLLVDSIVNSGSDSWTKFLNTCLEKLNEPVPTLPVIHKKGRKGRKARYFSNDNSFQKRRLSKFN